MQQEEEFDLEYESVDKFLEEAEKEIDAQLQKQQQWKAAQKKLVSKLKRENYFMQKQAETY
jgi:NH3-dependent NAD+ synthetase